MDGTNSWSIAAFPNGIFKWWVDIGHVWLVLEGVATLTLETFQEVMQVQKGENLEFSPADAST